MLINKQLTYSIVQNHSESTLEYEIINLTIGAIQLIIVNVYLPPYRNRLALVKEFDSAIQMIMNKFNNPKMIISGDLNMSNILWHLNIYIKYYISLER